MPAIMALAWTAWQQLELFLFLTALMPKGLMQIQPMWDFGTYIKSLGEIKYWHDFNSNIASVNDSRRNTVDVPDGMNIFFTKFYQTQSMLLIRTKFVQNFQLYILACLACSWAKRSSLKLKTCMPLWNENLDGSQRLCQIWKIYFYQILSDIKYAS